MKLRKLTVNLDQLMQAGQIPVIRAVRRERVYIVANEKLSGIERLGGADERIRTADLRITKPGSES